MMQHIATAKSEVAAFATGAESNSFNGSESNEQFGKLLQDQTSLDTFAGASEAAAPHSPRNAALQQSLDERETVSSSEVKEGTTVMESDDEDNTSDSLHAGEFVDNVNESVANNLNDEIKDGNTKSASIVTQDWVSLVDDLQKLADITRSTKQPLVDIESIEMSEADLKLDSKTPQNISMIVDAALGDVLTHAEEGLANIDVQQKVAELLLEKTGVLQELTSKQQLNSQESDTSEQKTLNTAIDPVIEKDLLSAKQQAESNAQIDLTLAENKALLRTLLVLVDSDTPEKLNQAQQTEALLTKLESVAEQGELLEPDSQMVQVATSNLLNSSKIEKVSGNNDIKNIVNLKDNKLDKVLENIAQRVFDGKNTDEPISTEQFAQQVVIPKVADISSSVGSATKDFISALKSGIEEYKNQLSQGREPGIDLKALVSDALAKTTDTGAVAKAPINLEQMVKSVSQVLDLAQTINRAIEHQHDQVYSASLRDAAQIQGTELGIDLKALMSDALAKKNDTGAVEKAPINLDQMDKRVSQVLDLAQTVNPAIEHQHDQVYSATLRDAAQIQGEQSKQIQLNQFESKFEKAINIAKPEGHQQLAEKVRWMVNTKNLVAEIRLDPAELGSVHVKVAISGESATVNFVVQSQQARDAVDTATPRLREMLAEKGIELGQSSVRQESGGQQGHGDGESAGQDGRGMGDTEDVDVSEQVLAQQNVVNGALGGIDYFV